MKLTEMLSTLRKYLKFYDRGVLTSATIAVQGSRVSLYINNNRHILSFISEISPSAGYGKRLDINQDNQFSLAGMSSSDLKEYIENFGKDISTEADSLPCYPTENALIITGSKLHTYISNILRIRDTSDNRFAEYLFLDNPNKDEKLRCIFCNSVGIAISSLDTPQAMTIEPIAIDLHSLEIMKSMIRKPAQYSISINKSCIYCSSDKERFCYQIKDESYYDKHSSILKLIYRMESDTDLPAIPATLDRMDTLRGICKTTSSSTTYKDILNRAITLEPSNGYVSARNTVSESVELSEIPSKIHTLPSCSFDSRRLYNLLSFMLSGIQEGNYSIQFMKRSYDSKRSVSLLKATAVSDKLTRMIYLAPVVL